MQVPPLMKLSIVLLLLSSSLLADQLTKGIARRQLASSPGISVMHGVLGFKYAENTGTFRSLGAEMTARTKFWLFTVLVAMILLALLVYSLTSSKMGWGSLMCSAMIIGGGMSNLLDRMQYDGAVIDYMFISLGGARSGIFNLADVMITLGLAGLLLSRGWRMLQARQGNGGG